MNPFPRHIFRHICYRHYHISASYIARECNCDHSTVISSANLINDLCSYDDKLKNDVQSILNSINNEIH